MSELKHNFVQGRMNKDLDERIVPNGEYRDATNIQVASSEDSDIGTIQNILGNHLVEDGLPRDLLPEQAICVGNISDEKNNKLYYFVQDIIQVEDYALKVEGANYYSWRDLILEYSDSSITPQEHGRITPVFVDTHTTQCRMHPDDNLQDKWGEAKYTLPIPVNSTDTYQHVPLIKEGMAVMSGSIGVAGAEFRTVINAEKHPTADFVLVTLDRPLDNPTLVTTFFFTAPKVLFPWSYAGEGRQRIITGVNIVDDFLIWTDNIGEPKKINIKDCIRGNRFFTGIPPHPTCLSHKEQYEYNRFGYNPKPTSWTPNWSISYYLQDPVEEQHITVIRKSPKTPPTLKMFTEREQFNKYSGVIKITASTNVLESSFLNQTGASSTTIYDFSSFSVGDIMYLDIDMDLNHLEDEPGTYDFWEQNYNNGQNTSVVIKEYSNQGSQPTIPITDYRIKGTIVNWSETDFAGVLSGGATIGSTSSGPITFGGRKIAVQITSIDGFPPAADSSTGERLYVIDSFLASDKLFEFKFPRFAYRWKYKDGEYSCFSPFSEIAFIPGAFDYHPKKGYNLGMRNNLKYVHINNFFNFQDTPDDVVEIDILYKEEDSTNIYVVKTIKVSDNIDNKGTAKNYWQFNSFGLASETVQSTISSNQLLRPFDNVPRRALAQEIIGSRIVYANYIQNFDLIDSVTNNPTFDITGHDFYTTQKDVPYSFSGTKSIKSLREYQLGVVFSDEYDRQTPVISHAASTVKLDKPYSWTSNKFSISFTQSYPNNMQRFKFFIKETAEEYYNMAMDRFYDAEDGNIWLAFASSDRNKVDIDTFLILKKGLDEGVQVDEPARYKILAIENEAPDFIKTSKLLICEETHNSTTNDIFGTTMTEAPGVGDDNFSVKYNVFWGTSGSNLHELKVGEKLYVEFTKNGVDQVSNRYEVTEITCDYDGDAANMSSSKYHFRIKGQFEDDISFITNDPSGINSTQIENGAQLRVYKYKVENKPQFDGRFFVKIYMDQIFSKYIKKVYEEIEEEYKVVASQKLYKLPDFNDPVWTSISPGVGFDSSRIAYNVLAHYKTEFKSWFQDYKFKQTGTENQDILEAGTSLPLGAGPWAHVASLGASPDFGPCETAHGWTMYYHCLEPDSTVTPSNLGEFNKKEPPAYWFIDEGPFRGWRWDNSMYSRFGYISPSDNVYELSTDTSHYNNGFGIDSSCSACGPDEWGLYLGFGGIWSNQWEWNGDPGRPINNGWHAEPDNNFLLQVAAQKDLHYENYDTIDDFYSIGQPGGNPKHTDQSHIVDKLTVGQKFRFAEDPAQTVYTLTPHIDEQQLVRYRKNDESYPGDFGGIAGTFVGDWDDPAGTYGSVAHGDPNASPPTGPGHLHLAALIDSKYGTSEKINTDFTNPANFTKNWSLVPTPSITWNPLGNGSGLIPGGFDLQLSTPNNGAAASLGSATGTTCLNCNGADDPNDFCLVLDSVLATDAAGSTVSLTKGLVLYEYTAYGAASATTLSTSYQNMLIKRIEYDSASDQYRVYLTGSTQLHSSNNNFIPKENTTLKFGQPVMNGFSPIFIENYHFNLDLENDTLLDAIGYTIEFLEPIEEKEVMPENPAVWETEPKENTPLDIYYEASGLLPIELTPDNIFSIIKREIAPFTVGEEYIINDVAHPVIKASGEDYYLKDATTNNVVFATDIALELGHHPLWPGVSAPQNSMPCIQVGGCDGGNIPYIGDSLIIPSHELDIEVSIAGFDGVITSGPDKYAKYVLINKNIWETAKFDLHWYNCYSFGNGVESNRIRDNFNLPYIKNGVRVSTTLEGQYKEEHRKYGLIYSGLYNSLSGTNNLNQFIQAEKITKDINPLYGSIQKLFTRDTDLITLCEDKVLKILANKDALYNADGNPQLTATDKVLGQTIPFVGEYGISTNPESFAAESYRCYFADKSRGAIIRLSRDGLTPISDHGMHDWFRDKMKERGAGLVEVPVLNPFILGSYDDRQQEYNVTFAPSRDYLGYNKSGTLTRGGNMQQARAAEVPLLSISQPTTVSFKESSKGWVSFKSFVPEHAVSANNNYFTFKNGRIWKHHVPKYDAVTNNIINHNTFYGDDNFFPSTFNVLINGMPEVVKSFKTLNYEGSKSKSIKNIKDDQYHNLNNKKGWFVNQIFTNKEEGNLKEFIEKEGKWFNYITGKPVLASDTGHLVDGFDSSAFATQGLGLQSQASTTGGIVGCTDSDAFNYDVTATTPCLGCCVDKVQGCTNPAATNYDPLANIDDSSCVILGCTDPTAVNYDADANSDDGSCWYNIWGCTDPSAFNYSTSATNDDGSCYPYIHGCMDPDAFNYNLGVAFANNPQTDVNTPCCTICDGHDDNNCCIEKVFGCTEDIACNYNSLANVDDGDCVLCGDNFHYVDNYDGASCNTGCQYCEVVSNFISTGATAVVVPPSSTIDVQWTNPDWNQNGVSMVNQYEIRWAESSPALTWFTPVQVNPSGPNSTQSYTITGLDLNKDYTIEIKTVCNNSYSVWAQITVTSAVGIMGCTDGTGSNMPAGSIGGVNVGIGTSISWGACNHDPAATFDDGSCEYLTCAGCTDDSYTEYYGGNGTGGNSNITVPSNTTTWPVDLGYCSTAAILGCTNGSAYNYNANANIDDGSCCLNAGCIDICANNYNPNACFDDGSCTYGVLCDSSFQNLGSATDSVIYPISNTHPTITTDQNNNGLTGAIGFDYVHNFWRNGLLPATPPGGMPCGNWYKFYTPKVVTPYLLQTAFQHGPRAFAPEKKLVFHTGMQNIGPGQLIHPMSSILAPHPYLTSTGVYQSVNTVPGETYELTIQVDNALRGFTSIAPPALGAEDGSFVLMLCDGNYDALDTGTHTVHNNPGHGIWPGCQVIEEGAAGWDLPVSGFEEVNDDNGDPITGQANFMPDGTNWTMTPTNWSNGQSAICTGSGPCTWPSGFSSFLGHNWNTSGHTKRVEKKVTFTGMGDNSILYVAYYNVKEIWNEYTPGSGLWRQVVSANGLYAANNTVAGSLLYVTAADAEVSKIELINVSGGPCNPVIGPSI